MRVRFNNGHQTDARAGSESPIPDWPNHSITSSARATSVAGINSDCPGGVQVDDEVESGRLPHWQVRGPLAPEDAGGVETGDAIAERKAGAIAPQSTGGGELPKRVHGRHLPPHTQSDHASRCEATMATPNKCLAESNKSLGQGKTTKKQNRQ